jgi:hypothetical protein
VPRSQRDGSLRPYSLFSRQEPLLFVSSSSSVVLSRLSGARSVTRIALLFYFTGKRHSCINFILRSNYQLSPTITSSLRKANSSASYIHCSFFTFCESPASAHRLCEVSSLLGWNIINSQTAPAVSLTRLNLFGQCNPLHLILHIFLHQT